MPDHLGDDMRKIRTPEEKEEKEIKSKCLLHIFVFRYLSQVTKN